MFSFVRNLVGVKTDQAVNSAVAALVRWDPQSATEAELRTMEQHLDELGMQVARARQSYDREQKEADAVQTLGTLRSRGFALGMISNASSELSALWAESAFDGLFDAALFSADAPLTPLSAPSSRPRSDRRRVRARMTAAPCRR